jgi:hypothetical protein
MVTEDSPISSAAAADNNARFMDFAPRKMTAGPHPVPELLERHLRRPAKP